MARLFYKGRCAIPIGSSVKGRHAGPLNSSSIAPILAELLISRRRSSFPCRFAATLEPSAFGRAFPSLHAVKVCAQVGGVLARLIPTLTVSESGGLFYRKMGKVG